MTTCSVARIPVFGSGRRMSGGQLTAPRSGSAIRHGADPIHGRRPGADFRGVTTPSFARILEEQLSAPWQISRPLAGGLPPHVPDLGLRVVLQGWSLPGRRWATSYGRPPVCGSPTAAPGPSSSATGPAAAATGAARDARRPAAAGSPGTAGCRHGRSCSTRPPLSEREAHALAAIRALGGDDLDAHALDRDLRRVFRRLARRYHPDRHPGLDGPARAALAARFSTLVEAYRVLAARTRTLHAR